MTQDALAGRLERLASDDANYRIAEKVVDQLSFSSNRMVKGRLVGEQCFAMAAICEALDAKDREAAAALRSARADALEEAIEAIAGAKIDGGHDFTRGLARAIEVVRALASRSEQEG